MSHSEAVEVIDGVGELDRLRAVGQTFTAVAIATVDEAVVSRIRRLIGARGEIHRFGRDVIVVLLPRPSNSAAHAEEIAADIRGRCAVAVGVAHSHPSATARDVVEAAMRTMRVEPGSSVQPGGRPCPDG